jgi:hypothetical protein
LHRHAAIFESIVPLLNLYDAHSIVVKNPLNLPNGFHLAISKLLAKFDAMAQLESFRHFRRKYQMRRALYLHSHSHAGCTRLTLSVGGKNSRKRMKVSTLMPQHTSRASLVSLEKNHVGYFLNSPRMMVFYEYVMNPVVI